MNPLLRFSGFLRKNDRTSPQNAAVQGAPVKVVLPPDAPNEVAPTVTNSPVSSVAQARAGALLQTSASLSSTRNEPQMGATLQAISGVRKLARPALRWVGNGGRTALREFDFAADANEVCAWQKETYSLNFPDFRYTDSFASAFRHDLRRAALDPHHGIFVLDEGELVGFLWLVICENTWTGERYGYVNNLYVASQRRGAGLSREMMAQAEKWFRENRIKRARLTVTTSNAAACKLYEKCGYATTRWEMEKEL